MPIPSPEHLKTIDSDQQAAKKAAQEQVERLKEEQQKTRAEVAQVINKESDPMKLLRAETTGEALKVLQEKTGQSLEFNNEQYSLMRKYVGERYAFLLSSRAEDYLRAHKDEMDKRGWDPEAKGAVALSYVEQLGAVEIIVEGDPELKKIYVATAALKEFGRTEIPPSGRFAVMEQLNLLQDLQKDNEELKKLRVEVFKKWSGRDPVINQAGLDFTANVEIAQETDKHLNELASNLNEDDKKLAASRGFTLQNFAMLKDMGYAFRSTPSSFLRRSRFEIIKDGKVVDFLNFAEIEREWRKKSNEERKDSVREKVKLGMDGAFVADITNKTGSELDAIYNGLEKDIYTQFDKKRLAATREGNEAIETGKEAVEGRGSISEFMRSAESQYDTLTHDLDRDKDKLIRDFHDQWGFDIDADTFTRFQEASGLDYTTYSKKRSGMLLYFLKLLAFARNEVKKASATI